MIYGGREHSFSDLPDVVRYVCDTLRARRHEFDTIVGVGLSGVTVAVPVALRLRKKLAIVRSAGSQRHSAHHVEGDVGRRWVLVDDFPSSGSTEDRAHRLISKHTPDTVQVGAVFYQSAQSARKGWHNR